MFKSQSLCRCVRASAASLRRCNCPCAMLTRLTPRCRRRPCRALLRPRPQAFDMLYLNGESLLKSTLEERRAKLHASFEIEQGKFEFAKHWEGTTNDELAGFLEESIKAGGEGLMVKTLSVNATYEPSKRSLNWLKLKKDYIDGMGDSLDLVPIAAYYGKGKRTGVYGAFLVACYNADEECFETTCKVRSCARCKSYSLPPRCPSLLPYHRPSVRASARTTRARIILCSLIGFPPSPSLSLFLLSLCRSARASPTRTSSSSQAR